MTLDAVPEWASFFSDAAYRAFVGHVEDDLRARGAAYEMGDGVVRLAQSYGDARACGLANLAQMCHRAGIERWRELIHHHFDVLFRSYEGEALSPATFAEAAPLLKARLYSEQYLSQVDPGKLVHREVASGLVLVLAYDLPTHIVTVAAEHVERWGRPREDLFDAAIANVRAERGVTLETYPIDGGAVVYGVVGESFFTASRAALLEEYVDPSLEHGALVCVPHRHTVLYHPLVAFDAAMAAIRALIPIGHRMFREGPGSISPNLYWWRAGTFTLLPARATDDTLQLEPPDAFVHGVLNRLAARGKPN